MSISCRAVQKLAYHNMHKLRFMDLLSRSQKKTCSTGPYYIFKNPKIQMGFSFDKPS